MSQFLAVGAVAPVLPIIGGGVCAMGGAHAPVVVAGVVDGGGVAPGAAAAFGDSETKLLQEARGVMKKERKKERKKARKKERKKEKRKKERNKERKK